MAKTKGNRTRLYWKNCKVCQYMKKNPVFRLRIMQSKYFNPHGTESLARVVHDFGGPFSLQLVYAHMKRHQENDLIKSRERFKEVEHPHTTPLVSPVAATVAAVVESDVVSRAPHEMGLDEFIYEGRKMLLAGQMNITATNYLAAIKVKSEIEKNTKDRRMDMIKQFFAGGQKKESE